MLITPTKYFDNNIKMALIRCDVKLVFFFYKRQKKRFTYSLVKILSTIEINIIWSSVIK